MMLSGVAIAAWQLWPSPERVIRRELAHIEEGLTYPPNESPLNAWAEVNQVCARLAADVEVEVQAPGIGWRRLEGREEVRTALLHWRQRYNGAEVRFPDTRVVLAPDHISAAVYVMVQARLPGERDTIFQEFKLTFRKEGRHWRIGRVETLEPLR
ncbi:MAG: hypothetical protein RMN51_08845 [Verrucomicrobiota bacterium]|nr:hypothetical protein [Limisphaera sp.]MDW8382198.1 hypothetical protein [Verrucomicrobiota bacterium]